jgi:hypothetical protein
MRVNPAGSMLEPDALEMPMATLTLTHGEREKARGHPAPESGQCLRELSLSLSRRDRKGGMGKDSALLEEAKPLSKGRPRPGGRARKKTEVSTDLTKPGAMFEDSFEHSGLASAHWPSSSSHWAGDWVRNDRSRPSFRTSLSAPSLSPRESMPTPPGVIVYNGTGHVTCSAPSGRDAMGGCFPGLRPGLSPFAPLGQSVGPSVGSEVQRCVGSKVVDYPIFVSASGQGVVEAVYADENVWLSQKMMGVLYGVDVRTISYHLSKIVSDNALEEDSVIQMFRITAADLSGVLPGLHMPRRLNP